MILPPAQPRPAKARGFTLLELVLVMMLLAVMLAVAAPSLRGFTAGSRSRDAVTQVVALAQFAKSRAATDSKVYRLNVDGTSYWLTMQEGESFIPTGTDFGQTFSLPAGMRVELVPAIANRTFDPTGISFYPDGRSDTAVFRLTDADEKITLLACPSPAESFRVVSSAEAAQL